MEQNSSRILQLQGSTARVGMEDFFQHQHSLVFAVIKEFEITKHCVLKCLRYTSEAGMEKGRHCVEWVWNIDGLIGLIKLDGKAFIVDRRDGQARADEEEAGVKPSRLLDPNVS